MGRSRRIAYPGAFFHCINRGHHRESIYRDEEDCQFMVDSLGEASARFGARIHGYCLIPIQKLAEVFCAAAGMAMGELFMPHKGSRQLSTLRDQIIYVATRLM